MWSSSVFYGKS
jgi:hypothetical protein